MKSKDQQQPDLSKSLDLVPGEISNPNDNSRSAIQPLIALPVYRPSDTRPTHDDLKLAKLGIHAYESKRLKLYTDIDPNLAKRLPEYIDAAYQAWEEYFGPLPPDREGADFQITGYIMVNKPLFQRAGLIPGNLRRFIAGRHRGYEFWMNDSKWDYYRRHLMIHEATHCFMYAIRDQRFPTWYMEGMAELFGTHRVDTKGKIHYRVMPSDVKDFIGLSRIEYVQQDVRTGRQKRVIDVMRLGAADFSRNQAYSWSWAFCKFLDSHPRYRKRFRALGRVLKSSRFVAEFRQLVASESHALPIEWMLFTRGLQYGYDFERAAINVVAGKPLGSRQNRHRGEIAANRGWQSTRLRVEKGKTYEVTASGRFVLAAKPKPWVSEPQGVSIVYFKGRPLGMIVGVIWPDKPPSSTGGKSKLTILPIGRNATFRAASSGTLYLRINDFWSQLADNSGKVVFQIREIVTQKP
ncbi:MAG: DUF1570 domain-containing protein [Planctomycetes bacterium]|nr:DUF1570 domain-containing protein [Planctomycetota bacterium]